SPSGQLKAYFSLTEQGEPTYRLEYKGMEVIKPSKLGLELTGNTRKVEFSGEGEPNTQQEVHSLYDGFRVVDRQRSTFDETWQPVWGETKNIRSHYNELALTLEQAGSARRLVIRFRLFDDGLGFRYEFPEQPNLTYLVIK